MPEQRELLIFGQLEMERVLSALPEHVSAHRKALLAQLLDDWAVCDVQEHFSHETAAERNARNKRLATLKKHAKQLRDSIEKLSDRDWKWMEITWGHDLDKDGPSATLTEITSAADRIIDVPSPGRPRNIAGYLICRDIAAIFEWVTGLKATRMVDRIDGSDTGRFWAFAAAVWPVVYPDGADGLSAAMKGWARDSQQFQERSAVIANMDFRHPEWRVFDP